MLTNGIILHETFKSVFLKQEDKIDSLVHLHLTEDHKWHIRS